MQRCPKCQTVKEDSEFGQNKSRRSGLAAICRECRRTANKEYWERNGRKYNKGGDRERKRKPDTEHDIEVRRRYVDANRERINARQREYYRRHKEERKQYYEANRASILARRREYCKRNMSKLMANFRDYTERYPERILAAKVVREAIEQKQLKPARKFKCADCCKKAEHLHHESYAEDQWLNVVPLCRSCHRKRHIMSNGV